MINACNKPKHGGPCKDNGFVFRKVTIPAQLGDDKTGQAKPENGAYTNSMVVYEASGAKYIYDSNGVYTILSEHPVYSVNKKTGAVVLKTSDIENDSGYVDGQFVDDAVDGAVTLEATLREASDDAIEQKLEDAVTGLNGRLLEETTLRKTSDDAIKEQIAEVAGDVADETSLRQDADSALEEKIEAEATTRTEADTNLQSQIDAISVASDVVDVVGTKTELDNYDTSALKPNDIIKVLQDESEEGATTYYRWSNSAFTYIGSEGPYYTKSEADTKISEDVTDAINEAVFASQENRRLVQIGAGADAKGNGSDNNIAIGVNSKVGATGVAIAGTTTAAASVAIYGSASGAYGTALRGTIDRANEAVAIGGTVGAFHHYAVALGNESTTDARQTVSVGNNIMQRRITYVGEPTGEHDAATKNYVDAQVGNIETILATINGGAA